MRLLNEAVTLPISAKPEAIIRPEPGVSVPLGR